MSNDPHEILRAFEPQPARPRFCYHVNPMHTVRSDAWIEVTCPDCPACGGFDPRIHDTMMMTPFVFPDDPT